LKIGFNFQRFQSSKFSSIITYRSHGKKGSKRFGNDDDDDDVVTTTTTIL